jgi:hypothetical protein
MLRIPRPPISLVIVVLTLIPTAVLVGAGWRNGGGGN